MSAEQESIRATFSDYDQKLKKAADESERTQILIEKLDASTKAISLGEKIIEKHNVVIDMLTKLVRMSYDLLFQKMDEKVSDHELTKYIPSVLDLEPARVDQTGAD